MQYRPRNRRRSRRRVRWGRLIAVLAGLAVAGFGLVKLIGYGIDWMASRQTAQELRAVLSESCCSSSASERSSW